MNKVSNPWTSWLYGGALFLAAYLTFELTRLGLDKFTFVMAGGRKYATFPDWETQLRISLSYLVLWLLYLVWFFWSRTKPGHPRFRSILRSTSIFLLLAFIAYPLGNDIYLYLHTGLMNLQEVNPFLTGAKQFISELSPLVDWGQPSTYGPLSQLLFTSSASLIQIHPLVAIYGYKMICLGLHLLNGRLIWSLVPSPDRTRTTIAYLLNPLLLMEQVSSGHVDILVCTCTIGVIGFLQRRWFILSVIALWAGFIAKTLPIIWMPLVGLYLLRQRQLSALGWSLFWSALLVTALGLESLPEPAAWKSLLNPGVEGQYQSSLAALVRDSLESLQANGTISLSSQQIRQVLNQLTSLGKIGFVLFYSWTALRGITHRYDRLHPLLTDLGWVTLVLFLIATAWVMPWYASLLIPIAALLPQARLFGFITLLFSFTSSFAYLLLRHDGLKGLVVVGIPLLVLAVWPLLSATEYRLKPSPAAPLKQ